MTVVTVEKACAWCTHLERLTAGMVGAEIEFQFSPDWDGLSRIAVFQGGGVTRDVLLSGPRCRIPWEVLTSPHKRVRAGVYGVNANGDVVLPTVFADIGIVFPAASPSDDPSADPTPELWAQATSLAEQALELAQRAAENAESVRKDADAGVFKGDPGNPGDPGRSPAVTVSEIENGVSVTVEDATGVKSFDITNGRDAKIIGATATVDDSVGAPAVNVVLGGTDRERTFDFKFTGLRGNAGGYYTPSVTQPDDKTMRVDFAASDDSMPDVPPVELALPTAISGGGTISVEDDGTGNVEITEAPSGWTVTDDGNGNVVIGG